MDTHRATPRLCLYATLVLTLLGVILRTACYFFFYDTDPGYFSDGILPTISNVLYFAAIAILTVCVFLTPRSAYSRNLSCPLRPLPTLGLACVLMVFFAAALLFSMAAADTTIGSGFRGHKLLTAAGITALLSALFYALSHNREGCYPDWLAFLGYAPVLWSIVSIGDIYFDPYVTMNSPTKLSLQLGLLGFMFISLCELRFRVGRFLPRYATAFWAIGSYASLVGSIPVLVATGAGILCDLSHLLYAAVLLFAGVYGLYLLFCYTVQPSLHTAE